MVKKLKVKVKVTLVQALRLCTGRTARRGSWGIALPFHDHGTRRGWGVSVTLRPLFTPGKTLYPLYRRLGGPQDRSGQVRKISLPTGIRSPDHPARSQSLYRLSYRAHAERNKHIKNHAETIEMWNGVCCFCREIGFYNSFHPPSPCRCGPTRSIHEVCRSHSDTPHSAGFISTSDQLDAETSVPLNTEHSQ